MHAARTAHVSYAFYPSAERGGSFVYRESKNRQDTWVNERMPFTLDRFCEVRPFLFHLTAQGNLNGIMALRTLFPASELLSVNGRVLPRLTPRRQQLHVERDGQWISIRDQDPLHAGNIEFEEGWDMPRFLSHLDSHVFFWPGKPNGLPIDYGARHRTRYAGELVALLRLRTSSLLAANPGLGPLFCRFNSGSPRAARGVKPPRGQGTFVPASDFNGVPSDVVEVVFNQAVMLPDDVEMSDRYEAGWVPLA